jgi:hypothetical protein
VIEPPAAFAGGSSVSCFRPDLLSYYAGAYAIISGSIRQFALNDDADMKERQPVIRLKESYQPRPIRFLELWQVTDWWMKIYGIAYQRPLPRPELIAAAKKVVHAQLSQLCDDYQHYGVGVLGIHDGRESNLVFVNFWADENELHHHVYISPQEIPQRLVDVTSSGLLACVWDLQVIYFEQQAWLDSVLRNPNGPDLERYLACRLNEDV